MIVQVHVAIDASKEKIWHIITDIENSVNTVSGIEKIEILNKPDHGLIGLKWQETRTLFGKTATEIMWIIDAEEYKFYRTQAESHGAIYNSELSIMEQDGKSTLTMDFTSTAQNFAAKLMAATMGFMFKSATKKALAQDLQDIKAAAEKQS